MGSLLLLPLGYLLAGPAAAALGAVEVTVVGGLIGAAAMALGVLPRSTRTLGLDDDTPPVDAPELQPA
jgi:hypothetical protein